MAQLWLTYEELVFEGVACNAATARLFAIRHKWTRKKSRDGLSRVLLPNAVAEKAICNMAERLLLGDRTVLLAAFSQNREGIDIYPDDRSPSSIISLSAA